ncbi:MAG: hypothetical protein PWP53_626 [Lacrimispora sp.]|nr:hypothetical protein [Lacrimispora sp.]
MRGLIDGRRRTNDGSCYNIVLIRVKSSDKRLRILLLAVRFHPTLTTYRDTDIMRIGDENDNTTAYAGYEYIPLSFIKN